MNYNLSDEFCIFNLTESMVNIVRESQRFRLFLLFNQIFISITLKLNNSFHTRNNNFLFKFMEFQDECDFEICFRCVTKFNSYFFTN